MNRHEVRRSRDALFAQGTKISTNAVSYFRKRLPDEESIEIGGLSYSLEHDVLTRDLGKHVLVLAVDDRFKRVASRVFIDRLRESVHAKYPSLEDWHSLVDGMVAASLRRQ